MGKIIHRAKFTYDELRSHQTLSVYAHCHENPIDLDKTEDGWTLHDDKVNCVKCLKIIADGGIIIGDGCCVIHNLDDCFSCCEKLGSHDNLKKRYDNFLKNISYLNDKGIQLMGWQSIKSPTITIREFALFFYKYENPLPKCFDDDYDVISFISTQVNVYFDPHILKGAGPEFILNFLSEKGMHELLLRKLRQTNVW